MLINAQRAQQLRVAIVEGNLLEDYQVEITDRDLTRGNIYRGVVANIQPSLNAAFIDIGGERHGFLPVADVLESAYHKKPPSDARRPRIDQVLEKGKTVVVQVTKDGVGQKGPALTTNIALAGRYLVLTPYDSVRGISRKASDDEARKKVRDRLKKLNLPDGHGVIVRTNGLDQNQATLNRDLNALIRLWKKIHGEVGKGRGPRFLYSDQDLVVQALRDYLDNTIAEVVVDDEEVMKKVEHYLATFMPRSKPKLTPYNERLPLFSRFRLETQIDRIYERTAPLPSGGYIVIDSTEALTAIDVNSGRATRNDNHDESILNTNLESAREVARQLRLRDIGGLVVIDFIDMRLRKHQNKLEKVMRDAMKVDKARYSVGRISPNGLLEINRQRIKQAIRLRTHRACPTCQGVGTIASAEFHALNLLGRIESRVATGLIDAVTVAIHPEIADVLQNRHRNRLSQLEEELSLRIEIIAAPGLRRLEERLDFHQREGGPVVPDKTAPALNAADLTMPGGRRRRAVSTDDDEDDAQTGRKRRRRRRRSKSRDAEAEATEATTDEQQAAQGDDEEAPTRRRPTRRRRRTKADAEQEAKGDSKADSGDEAQEDKDKKPVRRRRRRVSVRKDDSDNAVEVSGNGDTPDGDAEERPTRRRPSRRRRRPSADDTLPDGPPPSAPAVEFTDGLAEDRGDEPPKRRRRRTRRKSDGDEGPPPRERQAKQPKTRRTSSRSSKRGPVDGNRAPKQKKREVDGNRAPSGANGNREVDGNRAPKRKRKTTVDGQLPDVLPPNKDLPGAHDPRQPPPKRTGSSSQSLRWQWLGGPGKGGSDSGVDEG